MDMKDFGKFGEYMGILGEIVGKEATANRIKIYWKILSKYPADQVFSGFERLFTKPMLLKFPVPGDIIAQFQEDGDFLAFKAWEKVKKGIRQAGYMNSVKFDDPVIHSVINIVFGGWVKFCSMSEDEERFYRPQFFKAYKSINGNGRKMGVIKYLAGAGELCNSARGMAVSPPVMISDNECLTEGIMELGSANGADET